MGYLTRDQFLADEYRRGTSYLRRVASRFKSLSSDDKEELVFMTLADATEQAIKGHEKPMIYWRKVLLAYGGERLERRRREMSIDATTDEVGHVPVPTTRANQIPYMVLGDTLRAIDMMPPDTKAVMLLRADGANPIEISDETGFDVVDVLDLLSAGRTRLELIDGCRTEQ